MIVNSHNIEFGYELISALPYAYYLHSKGELAKTISGNDTECLYYFSPNHEINPEPRSWYNTPKAVNIPNIDIHKPYLKKDQFLTPPFKKQYANKEFKFKKETIVICNRHNIEWGKKPINFFNLKTLEQMFVMLQDKYQIVYINVEGRKELYDNAPPIELGDYDLLKKYPKVINIHDLHKKGTSFNELQLKIFANCKKYITMNGGHSILASYFGGENIIMSKYGHPQTREINPENNSFYRWYHEFGDQRIKHVSNESKLIGTIKSWWVDKDPIINILIRTSNRPKYFNNCINSILKQTYKNINIYVSIDNNNKYTIKYPVYPVYVKETNGIKPIDNNHTYGIPFPANLYLNNLQDKVKSGLIMYLDDDDMLCDSNVLETIAKEYKEGSRLIYWKVESAGKIIPSKKNWGKAPVCRDISGIGFAFGANYKKFAKWEPYKRGDYRVSAKLHSKIDKKKYIDKILTRTQNGQHSGNQKDANILFETSSWYVTPEGGFWYGADSIGRKKISQGKMRKADINEIPAKLLKN
jgi:hypothetical protein